MGLRTVLRGLAAASVAVFVAPVGAGAAVTLVSDDNNSIIAAVDNFAGTASNVTPLTSIPGTFEAYAEDSFSEGDPDFAFTKAALSQSAFVFTFDHLARFSQTVSQGGVSFTVDVATTYAISGSFAASGEEIYFQQLSARLTADEATLYRSSQFGAYGGENTLTLGGQAGTSEYLLDGSATGVLLPGVTYTFGFRALLEPVTDPSGTGTVTLAFAPVNGNPPGGPGGQVPLPAAVWVGLAAGAGVVARARRR